MKASGAKSRGPLAEGELIAIDETAFHVLSTTGLQSVPRASVRRITLVGYGNRAGTLTGWASAGMWLSNITRRLRIESSSTIVDQARAKNWNEDEFSIALYWATPFVNDFSEPHTTARFEYARLFGVQIEKHMFEGLFQPQTQAPVVLRTG